MGESHFFFLKIKSLSPKRGVGWNEHPYGLNLGHAPKSQHSVGNSMQPR